MRTIVGCLFFIFFVATSYSDELKLMTGTFEQKQKITVTIMDANNKIQTETKTIPIKYKYAKVPKIKNKKIPVSTNSTSTIPSFYVVQSLTVSACASTTTNYVITASGKRFVVKKIERDIETKITNNELREVAKNGKTF